MLRVMLLLACLGLARGEERVPDPADGLLLRRVHEEVLELVDRMTTKRDSLRGFAPRYGAEAASPELEIERGMLRGELERLLGELDAKQEEFQERSRRHQLLRGALLLRNMGARDQGAAQGDARSVIEYEEAPREVSEFIRSVRDALAADAEAFAAYAASRAARARSRARALCAAAAAAAAAAALALLAWRRRRRAR